MSDYTVRALRADEHRAANELFRSTLHVSVPSDEEWEHARHAYQPGRTLGAFDTELIGTARSFDAELTVPGGNRVPMAAVTAVGVRADRTRRGVLTSLMRTQLDDVAARGVPVAALYASEAIIYGRFGYGMATRSHHYTVDRRRAVLRSDVPAGGEVELLKPDTMMDRLPEIYAGLPHPRPGMMTRPGYWWPSLARSVHRSEAPVAAAVHHGSRGPDGFVVYTTQRKAGEHPSILRVMELSSGNTEAFAGLWRYLLGVDLIDLVKLQMRPPDEPTALMFTDPRMCSTIPGIDDGLWLRLVDVPAALAARDYDGEPLVIEVVDPVLETNSGRYRIAAGKVSRTAEPAGLRVGVDALAMMYLGGWRASALAGAGRIQPIDPRAVTMADRLFGTGVAPWCGTFF